jgi:ABC-type dipeptide/oligopeptide/nickel transport system permease subunit
MLKHILPNSISPIIVMMTQQIGATILAEAGLSFLGLGISSPMASWGSMVNEGKNYLIQNPVFALAPGVCVALLVICLNMFGDGIRDALDPRLRGEI